MAHLGERASLTILREQSYGLFLDAGDELGEVLLPRREMPTKWQIGGEVEVFLYLDSEDRPVATMKHPKVMPGGFAYLECLAITGVGAFLDWGLPKDLLLPFREQKERIEVGRSYVVHVHVDAASGRIVATRRLNKFLNKTPAAYKEGQEVELLLYGKTELGYKAIVEGRHSGVLFANEVFRRLRAGEKTKGYIVKVHPEGKIDLSLYPPGRARINDLETRIEEELRQRGGFWAISDASPAETIHQALGVSKKAFKQATGALFKKRRITISDEGIGLVVD
ncbi:MAG: GntR family transcriptional regulator [Verrucomicrobia bacterium]|nr:MAG: GntR family transcriptional regulator [Verrucomicrobiota bacterium]TAE87279.1 MAG: GntR family transcriptional regulator [Verrucomicrobiota bacterium]TAF25114.1 MAG: GntR family transcriptional regulator [Verrucomicrobiota bacterium]